MNYKRERYMISTLSERSETSFTDTVKSLTLSLVLCDELRLFISIEQLYMKFFIGEYAVVHINIENCLYSIMAWMKPNMMSCNTDKTEMSIISM